MLRHLDIRNFILIDHLALEFGPGLSVLTGETGAGKSILLDALGLVRGDRMDGDFIRARCDQASVTATFDVPGGHSVFAVLNDQGIAVEDHGLYLRRVLTRDGKSRAFVNDQPVTVQTLKIVAALLVDIHGQFETGQLFKPSYHRDVLDHFGQLFSLRNDVAAAYTEWQVAQDHDAALHAQAAKAQQDEEYMRRTLEDLRALDPHVGEEETLLSRKKFLNDHAQITAWITDAYDLIAGDNGAESLAARAGRVIDRLNTKWPERAGVWVTGLDTALVALRDLSGGLGQALRQDTDDFHTLDQVEDRLYDLRAFARRLGGAIDDLPAAMKTLESQLGLIEDQGAALAKSSENVRRAQDAYMTVAGMLHEKRVVAAKKLSIAVMKELPPLKLDRAVFAVDVTHVDTTQYGPHGIDQVQFTGTMNPGAPPSALNKIASGGELSRLMLALKVVVQAGVRDDMTLIFDEIDAGVGGAVASAMAERLHRLGAKAQVLAVTHAPQVAAMADHHFVVEKSTVKGQTKTSIRGVDRPTERREEIARMLSGARVTDAARAAAVQLLEHKAA
jgi:DNA repair protein RecN (Recombination protein N)